MYVRIIDVPYDSGHWGVRMGRGPGALLAAGLPERLRAAGRRVELERVRTVVRFPTEIATAFEVARGISRAVRAAAWHTRFPLVLMGNCLGALGVVAGLGAGRTGVVWLDAHADFNTPESSRSGFLDGMALATLTGRCWTGMVQQLPGFRPVPPENVLLVGARDLDPAEGPMLRDAGVARVAADEIGEPLATALERLAGRVDRVYLHLDLDVLDLPGGRANGLAPGPEVETQGVGPDGLIAAIRAIRGRVRVAAAGISAYDPEHDPAGAVREVALLAAVELSQLPPARPTSDDLADHPFAR
jgi:arginase